MPGGFLPILEEALCSLADLFMLPLLSFYRFFFGWWIASFLIFTYSHISPFFVSGPEESHFFCGSLVREGGSVPLCD